MKKNMRKPTTAELTGQIITDSVLSFLNYMPNPDDVASGTWDSYNTYRKMRTDPRVKSLLSKIKSAALNFPCHIVQEDADNRVYEFIGKIDLFKNLYKKQRRMLTALDYGFSVSELIWKREGGGFVPENIITRKPERFSFDSAWNLYNQDIGSRSLLNQSYKWLIYQHDPDDENPYGTSMLRCVYWPWMFKQAGYDFWLQATEKFAVKSLYALFDSDGDEEKVRSRAMSIAEMLMGIESGSSAAIGNVKEIKDIGMSGDLSSFREMVEACDVQISYGLTGQSIATSNTNGGSLALGEVQADLLYEDCKGIALELQNVLQHVIDWTVELNFGPGVAAPQIVFDVERRASFDQIIQAIDRNIPVSKSALYSQYGLPEPKDEADSFVKPAGNGMMLSDGGSPGTVKKNFSFF